MAILVEEEKNNQNLTSSLGWVVIGGIILVAAYYIFFAEPTPSVVVPPKSLENISAVGALTFDPTSVLNGASYQALRQTVPSPVPTGPGGVGRPNPFLAP